MGFNVLAVVRLARVSGLPQDVCVNTFAFRDFITAALGTVAQNAVDKVKDFYNVENAVDDVAEFIGPQISRGAAAHSIDIYDLGDPVSLPMGSPVLTSTMSLDPTGGGRAMVGEAAATLSFHADLTDIPQEVGNTRPAARRRGRVFIGPLQDGAVTNVNEPLLSAACIAALHDSGEALRDSGGNTDWAVWSRVEGLLRPVVGGFVDNAPDVQRRRGAGATSRSSF